jgi:hypothetical protein
LFALHKTAGKAIVDFLVSHKNEMKDGCIWLRRQWNKLTKQSSEDAEATIDGAQQVFEEIISAGNGEDLDKLLNLLSEVKAFAMMAVPDDDKKKEAEGLQRAVSGEGGSVASSVHQSNIKAKNVVGIVHGNANFS